MSTLRPFKIAALVAASIAVVVYVIIIVIAVLRLPVFEEYEMYSCSNHPMIACDAMRSKPAPIPLEYALGLGLTLVPEVFCLLFAIWLAIWLLVLLPISGIRKVIHFLQREGILRS
jgi:hypothetical protein